MFLWTLLYIFLMTIVNIYNDYIPTSKNEIIGSCLYICSAIVDAMKQFTKMVVPTYTPTSSLWELMFFPSLPTCTWYVSFSFNLASPMGSSRIECWFYLHFLDDQWPGASAYVYLPFSYFLLWYRLFMLSFALFCNGLISFLKLIWSSSLYSRDSNPGLDNRYCKYIFPL